MRVISGTARRTLLSAPKGQNTRPTADRVKENAFNIIATQLHGAIVLDLFCGSGAIGIEALSRGAAHAVFVDTSVDAVNVTEENLQHVRFTDRAQVLNMCALKAIDRLKKKGMKFDIIYLDPPYGVGLLDEAMQALALSDLLAPDGMIIAEYDKDEPPPSHTSFHMLDQRKYGNTRVSFYWHLEGKAQ